LKLLVFEYITGGGLVGQTLPASLVAEGRLMLQALLDDVKQIPAVQILLPLDQRCTGLTLPANTQVFPVKESDDIGQILTQLITQADLVWPIAPETDNILFKLARQIEALQKTALLSSPETVAICADKLATYRSLIARAIPVVETLALVGWTEPPFPQSVIKPIDGVGCEDNRIIPTAEDFKSVIESLDQSKRFLIQPLLTGQAVSLSCLFKQGKAWLISCNQQQMLIQNNRFSLAACLVNVANQNQVFYQGLIQQIAQALPGLWGYIGIDLIETPDQGPLILEINPRLTTSYVGIKQASGINVAEQVIKLLDGEPDLHFFNPKPIRVVIH